MTTLTGKETMRAARIHKFGGPEVLETEETAIPEPQEKEILVHVHAAGVNPVDWKIREGDLGEFPLPMTMGLDFSGVVEALGPNVEEFRAGQAVFGTVAETSGSYAEYALAEVNRAIEKPSALDHVTAAALPTAALTAWQALFDHANLVPNQNVLVHGAAGGVGSFAVQLARWKGAKVTGTASGKHQDYLKSLGANKVIDYKAKPFEKVVRDVDVVFDTIGGETQQRSWSVLKPGGILVSIVQPPDAKSGNEGRPRGVFFRCDHKRIDQLTQIAELVVSGKLKAHIEACLPLGEARQALESSQSGHTRGKIILKTLCPC